MYPYTLNHMPVNVPLRPAMPPVGQKKKDARS